MNFIDVHCHIEEYYNQLDEIVRRSLENNVRILIGVGSDIEGDTKVLEAARKYPDIIKPCIGIHPWEAPDISDSELLEFERLVNKNIDIIVGLGEVGLDRRFVKGERFNRSLKVFEEIVKIAREFDLPLNIHSLKAEKIIFEMLQKYDIDKALFHWYTGSFEVLDNIISVGYRVSVNLSLRYSKRAREISRRTPIALIMLESDSPYDFRGEEATPWSIVKVAKMLSEIKGLSVEEIAEITSRNARIFFSI